MKHQLRIKSVSSLQLSAGTEYRLLRPRDSLNGFAGAQAPLSTWILLCSFGLGSSFSALRGRLRAWTRHVHFPSYLGLRHHVQC